MKNRLTTSQTLPLNLLEGLLESQELNLELIKYSIVSLKKKIAAHPDKNKRTKKHTAT